MTLFVLVGLVHMPVGLLGIVGASLFHMFLLLFSGIRSYFGDVFLIEIIEVQEGKWKM